MAKESNLGKKIRCPKCGTQVYDLGRKFFSCPSCHKASLIKSGSIAPVRLGIKPGGHNDPEQGWTDGCATRNQAGAVYLNCQFEVTGGEFAGKKFASLVGLHTPKGPWWGNEGRKTLRGILNSAHSLEDDDYSPEALASRHLNSLTAFDGIEFIAEIGVRKGTDGLERNELKAPITPDDPKFRELHRTDARSASEIVTEKLDKSGSPDPTQNLKFTPVWLGKA